MITGIIGGGISGLTLAYELQRQGQAYHLWEASDTPGGYIRSVRDGTYLRELGPNSLLGDQELLDWLANLGLTNDLLFAKPVSKSRYIFRRGQYRKLPSGPPSLLFGGFFSWKTKWAVFRELSNKTTSPAGETLTQFFQRRFTDELVDYALAPFVAGIYAGDPEELLVSETFPVLLTYEKEYGSVLRGLIKNQSATGRRQSFSFRNGMQTLPIALAQQLTHVRYNQPVQRIDRLSGGQWQVNTASGPVVVDRLVICTGTDPAARLLESYYPTVATALRQIEYPPMTAVHSVYKRDDVTHPLDGFGALNPKVEGRFAAGHIWSSSTFDFRCPAGEVLFTTFVGGTAGVGKAQLPDDTLLQQVHQELSDAFGISAATPVRRDIYRWERAIPQYNARALALKQQIPALESDGVWVCANWYGGVSLSDCIKKAKALAVNFLS